VPTPLSKRDAQGGSARVKYIPKLLLTCQYTRCARRSRQGALPSFLFSRRLPCCLLTNLPMPVTFVLYFM
jgi:hypothetical protein